MGWGGDKNVTISLANLLQNGITCKLVKQSKTWKTVHFSVSTLGLECVYVCVEKEAVLHPSLR